MGWRIEVSETSGITGRVDKLGSIDTGAVRDGAELEQRLNDIGFFDLPAEVALGWGADIPEITMTVTRDGGSHTVAFPALQPPGPIRKDLDGLQEVAHAVLIDAVVDEPLRMFRLNRVSLQSAVLEGAWGVDQTARISYTMDGGFTLEVGVVNGPAGHPRPLTADERTALIRVLVTQQDGRRQPARGVIEALLVILGHRVFEPL